MSKYYEVEVSFVDKRGYCCTEIKTFDDAEAQQEYAFKKFHEENVYEVRKITEESWRKEKINISFT